METDETFEDICDVVQDRLGGLDGMLSVPVCTANDPHALFPVKTWDDVHRMDCLQAELASRVFCNNSQYPSEFDFTWVGVLCPTSEAPF